VIAAAEVSLTILASASDRRAGVRQSRHVSIRAACVAWKAEHLHFIFLDDAEVQIAVERCGRYWVPIVHFADAPSGRAIPTVF
jgi:hypothetical protein